MPMSIDAADLEAARALEATLPQSDELQPLQTVASVLAFMATAARAEGDDPCDGVELVVRLADLSPDDVREVERALRPLGYRDICAGLREITGRRQRDLKPL
jgi:hypothetical protein